VSVVVQPRVARRLIAAGAAAIALLLVLLVLLVATLMGGMAPPNTCGPGAGTGYAPSPVALADIPGNYLQWIRQAGDRYGLDWSVIAGIYSIESDFGRRDAPGVRSGENFAGAGGPGQFLAATWRRYGVDGDGDGVKDRYNPADAIPGTGTSFAGAARRLTIGARSSPTTTPAGMSTTCSRARVATGAPRRPTRTLCRRPSSPTLPRPRSVRNSWALAGPQISTGPSA
jgi:hypothetical protein